MYLSGMIIYNTCSVAYLYQAIVYSLIVDVAITFENSFDNW